MRQITTQSARLVFAKMLEEAEDTGMNRAPSDYNPDSRVDQLITDFDERNAEVKQ